MASKDSAVAIEMTATSASQAAPDQASASSDEHGQPTARQIQYITGPRFYLIVFAICVSLFLTSFEIPVVTTSIVPIAASLGHLSLSAWVVSAYLLGYVSFLVIFAKLSDIFGRKPLFFLCLSLFTIFSGACAAANTMQQLIILRAFQGFAGGGCYSVPIVMSLELVPQEQFAALTAFLSAVVAISMIAGPVVGGAISNSVHGLGWRWAFLLNVPAAVPALIIVVFIIPSGFPYHNLNASRLERSRPNRALRLMGMFTRENIQRVDFLGGGLLLLATLSMVAAFEEAGLDFGWGSPFVISLLCISVITWAAFVLWERCVSLRYKCSSTNTEPVFPWHFFTDRIWLGMSLAMLSVGAVWVAAVFQLPMRFQVLHGLSSLDAGLRVMAYTGIAPISSIVASGIAKKGVPPIYLVLSGACIQVVGFALLGSIKVSETGGLDQIRSIQTSQYGYQVLAGFGCGANIALLGLMTPFSVKVEDLAVALGGITQTRLMGSALGVSIVTTAMHTFLRGRLGGLLGPAKLDQVLDNSAAIGMLESEELQAEVLRAFADGYNLQMRILAGLVVGQFIGVALMWKHGRQIKV